MIRTEEIEYQDEDTLCRAFLAYEEAKDARPCILVAHDWGGRNKDACNKARQLASLGYVGFAIDMYGEAQTAEEKSEKRALMTPLMQDRKKLASRIVAAYEACKQLTQVDSCKIAAIGYCFGGLCVLDLARTGTALQGVVCFHGLLSTPPDAIFTEIPAKILVLHGYDDPLVPHAQIYSFTEEMTARKADWQIHLYGLTAHSFTNPEANDDEMGLHYNKTADQRSWQNTLLFLQEIL